MIEGFEFAPNASHAAQCNRAMQAGLADSLRQILAAADGNIDFDSEPIRRVIDDIDTGRNVSPNAFALYYELVPALLEGRLEAAQAMLLELGRQRPVETRLNLLAAGEAALADREARYLRFMTDGTGNLYQFLPPTPSDLAAFKDQFGKATALLQQAAPELLSEIKALISELILVVGLPGATVHFEGGSSYQLWGALFLNATRNRTRVELIDALAHESAHSRLFGLCIDEAAVRNEDDELHASPLRADPRPMDGVYHATFVSARMHWAMARLIGSGLLTEEEQAVAIKSCDDNRRNFELGYETVAQHAQLTATGDKAMAAALSYMRTTA